MKLKLKTLAAVLALLLALGPAPAAAAGCAGTGNCFWTLGTGNASSTANWATLTGGVVTGSIPTSADICNFDAASSVANAAYTWTINVSTNCLDFLMGGPGGGNKVTWAGSSAISVFGGVNMSGGSGGTTVTYTGTLTLASTSGSANFTINGVDLTTLARISRNGAGGTTVFADDSTKFPALRINSGTMDLTGRTISTPALDRTLTSTSVLILTNAVISITGTGNAFNLLSSGLTVNASGSTIAYTDSSATAKTLTGANLTFGNFWHHGGGVLTFANADTWADVKIDGDATVKFKTGAKTTLTSITSAGTSGHNAIIQSDTNGTTTRTLKVSGSPISTDYLTIQDLKCEGVCCLAGSHSTDGGNNRGWIFVTNTPTCPNVMFAGGI